jgi:hypothetical protein
MVWYGMDTVCGMVWTLVWFGMIWVGLVWFGLVWFGLVWFGLVWFGMVWFGMVLRSSYCYKLSYFFCLVDEIKTSTTNIE